jgi:hypothetical protein
VNDAVEPPLNAHLLVSSEAEAIQAEARSYIGEDGFDRRHQAKLDLSSRCGSFILLLPGSMNLFHGPKNLSSGVNDNHRNCGV